jgi:hypothetical protein
VEILPCTLDLGELQNLPDKRWCFETFPIPIESLDLKGLWQGRSTSQLHLGMMSYVLVWRVYAHYY